MLGCQQARSRKAQVSRRGWWQAHHRQQVPSQGSGAHESGVQEFLAQGVCPAPVWCGRRAVPFGSPVLFGYPVPFGSPMLVGLGCSDGSWVVVVAREMSVCAFAVEVTDGALGVEGSAVSGSSVSG